MTKYSDCSDCGKNEALRYAAQSPIVFRKTHCDQKECGRRTIVFRIETIILREIKLGRLLIPARKMTGFGLVREAEEERVSEVRSKPGELQFICQDLMFSGAPASENRKEATLPEPAKKRPRIQEPSGWARRLRTTCPCPQYQIFFFSSQCNNSVDI
uniref:Uncharacterized protein n=1 Tax=Onchocerca volvulus TaxID=6282 RepID=A0A8R1XZP7_ONCVO